MRSADQSNDPEDSRFSPRAKRDASEGRTLGGHAAGDALRRLFGRETGERVEDASDPAFWSKGLGHRRLPRRAGAAGVRLAAALIALLAGSLSIPSASAIEAWEPACRDFLVEHDFGWYNRTFPLQKAEVLGDDSTDRGLSRLPAIWHRGQRSPSLQPGQGGRALLSLAISIVGP